MSNYRPVVTLLCSLSLGAGVTSTLSAQMELEDELAMARPITALNTIWIEEMTWLEIRDALAEGASTVIVSTGGIEQNGPYVAMGKHNYVPEGACEGIARRLGDALCAPIIKLVPEGNVNPPSGHMQYTGTISVRQETFEAMLEDVGRSLKQHGFEHIVYIGDSGGEPDRHGERRSQAERGMARRDAGALHRGVLLQRGRSVAHGRDLRHHRG